MGDLIVLAEHRVRHAPQSPRRDASRPVRVTFAFDLASPFTYLAAERVDRLLPDAHWRPVLSTARDGVTPVARAAAEARAAALRIPLVWPDRLDADPRGLSRAAAWATEAGRGSAFGLAASRLAFCGAFELEDPELLAEAATAAGLAADDALRAARHGHLDAPMRAEGERLAGLGAGRLPVVQVGSTLFCGEGRVAEAVAATHAAAAAARERVPRAG